MLSQETRKQIIPTGLYRRKVDWKKIGLGRDAYWCTNWTFIPQISEEEVVMIDSYYQSYQDSILYYLDDENAKDFELIFDFNDVVEVSERTFNEYDDKDRYRVSCDSGGRSYPKCFIKKSASPSKKRQLEYIDSEIDSCETKLRHLKDKRKSIAGGQLVSY